jgi:hypothetical protein
MVHGVGGHRQSLGRRMVSGFLAQSRDCVGRAGSIYDEAWETAISRWRAWCSITTRIRSTRVTTGCGRCCRSTAVDSPTRTVGHETTRGSSRSGVASRRETLPCCGKRRRWTGWSRSWVGRWSTTTRNAGTRRCIINLRGVPRELVGRGSLVGDLSRYWPVKWSGLRGSDPSRSAVASERAEPSRRSSPLPSTVGRASSTELVSQGVTLQSRPRPVNPLHSGSIDTLRPLFSTVGPADWMTPSRASCPTMIGMDVSLRSVTPRVARSLYGDMPSPAPGCA